MAVRNLSRALQYEDLARSVTEMTALRVDLAWAARWFLVLMDRAVCGVNHTSNTHEIWLDGSVNNHPIQGGPQAQIICSARTLVLGLLDMTRIHGVSLGRHGRLSALRRLYMIINAGHN